MWRRFASATTKQETRGGCRLEEVLVHLRHVVGAGALTLLAASCSLGNPEEAPAINLFLEVDKAVLQSGEAMTITVTAQNVGYGPVSLTGPSDCLLYTEVLNAQGQVVWHSNGACTGGSVTVSLAPGEARTQSFTWDGSNLNGAQLGPDLYFIRPVVRMTGAPYVGSARSVSIG
jgi:hypothetical protein